MSPTALIAFDDVQLLFGRGEEGSTFENTVNAVLQSIDGAQLMFGGTKEPWPHVTVPTFNGDVLLARESTVEEDKAGRSLGVEGNVGGSCEILVGDTFIFSGNNRLLGSRSGTFAGDSTQQSPAVAVTGLEFDNVSTLT